MDRERFSDILKEYDYSDEQIKLLWDSRPDDDIDEQRLRETAAHFTATKSGWKVMSWFKDDPN